MKLQNVGTVIATRQLDLADGRKVTVTIGKPEKFPDGVNYYCPYQIAGIKRDKVRHSGGVDAVQALELALKMIGANLYTSDEAQAGMLSWEGGRRDNRGQTTVSEKKKGPGSIYSSLQFILVAFRHAPSRPPRHPRYSVAHHSARQ